MQGTCGASGVKQSNPDGREPRARRLKATAKAVLVHRERLRAHPWAGSCSQGQFQVIDGEHQAGIAIAGIGGDKT